MSDWIDQNASRFTGELKHDEPLSRHTYYRIGGPATLLCVPKSVEDLRWISEMLRETGLPLFVLGLGSNLLVSDAGFRGAVVKASRVNLDIACSGDGSRLRTGGSVAISSLLRRAVQEGWGGLEFLTGVPGSVGGAIRMNAGTHLGETKDRVRRIEAYPLVAPRAEEIQPLIFEGEQLKFQYRKNLFLPAGAVVTSVEWEIRRENPDRVKAAIDETLQRRKSTQPIDYPSCGSVFKNPRAHGLHAWQVIDKLGLRGHRIGDAQFAEKHSNFIINLGAARASDVSALIQLAKSRAKAELGIELEEEVIYLGE